MVYLNGAEPDGWASQRWQKDLKCQQSWRPQSARDIPKRIYEAFSATLDRPPDELVTLMGHLIAEWKRQAGEVLARFGYRAEWSATAKEVAK